MANIHKSNKMTVANTKNIREYIKNTLFERI